MQADKQRDSLPLYVDLDGTLVQTDVAQELLVQAARKRSQWVPLLQAAKSGVSEVKAVSANLTQFDPATLPYHPKVLAYIQEAKSEGRRVVLATAADDTVAQRIANHLGLFDKVIASSPGDNMKGAVKLGAIQADAGSDTEFEYIGDSAADVPIWNAASVVGLINVPPPLQREVTTGKRVSIGVDDAPNTIQEIWRAMRPHQWAKNALILLPLFMSHRYVEFLPVLHALLALAIFSCCASAIYIINDLLDIEADRQHPTKRRRPFAAATLRPLTGLQVSAGLMIGGLVLSLIFFSWKLTLLYIVYLCITTLYTMWLKHKAVMDIVVLTCLYTLRIFIGGVAIGEAVSPWLLNFSLFFFASLALMKRYTELSEYPSDHVPQIRGYYASDTLALLAMGLSAGGMSVLTLTLYLNSDFVAQAYASPSILWLIAPLTLFWIFRAWLLALRQYIHDDPVVFALRDKTSRIVVVLMGILVISAKYVTL